MIVDAIINGARKFIVGIGGSATNDGGVGMLQALGFKFRDFSGSELSRGGAALRGLKSIDRSQAIAALSDCVFKIACDVTNPLLGATGASAVYGPQKGATPEMVAELDEALKVYSSVAGGDANFPGAGAAGGLGFAFKTFLGGELKSGVQLVLDETGFEDRVRDADIVVTGEGRLDGQSAMGKAPVGVAKLAKRYSKLVVAFSGCVTEDATLCNENGIDAFFPILRAPVSLSEAMNLENAKKNLTATAEQAFRLTKALTK
jgi:glycerate kinase